MRGIVLLYNLLRARAVYLCMVTEIILQRSWGKKKMSVCIVLYHRTLHLFKYGLKISLNLACFTTLDYCMQPIRKRVGVGFFELKLSGDLFKISHQFQIFDIYLIFLPKISFTI